MTVGELRKALEGVPDFYIVARNDETWWVIVDRAEVAQTKPIGEHDLGDLDECEKGESGTPAFLIS
jgi:hypothetical protein